MKIHDQHVHSYYSFDTDQKIEDYLEKAASLGLKHFVLTDHYDLNYLDEHKDLSFDIEKQHKELEGLQKKYPNIKILHGIELGYKPIELDRIEKTIHSHHFDVINLSLHESDGIDYYFFRDYQKYGVNKTLEIYFSRELEAVKNFDNFDVFSHLDYGFKTAYLNDSSLSIQKYEEILIKIMKELIKKHKALEINTKVQESLPLEHTKYLLNLYFKLGGKYLTLSSDAHEANRYYSSFDIYLKLIKEVGFTHLTYFINRKKHLLKI